MPFPRRCSSARLTASKEHSDMRCLQTHLEKIMKSGENSKKLEESAGPHPVRTTDNPVTTEDIGLPTGIQPDEVAKLEEVKPDLQKIKDKS
jgi:hypothetical protein